MKKIITSMSVSERVYAAILLPVPVMIFGFIVYVVSVNILNHI